MGSSLGVASPYITRGAGSFTDPGVAGRYMSPYIQNVVSGIGDIAARNLREKILPEVNRTFIGGGTFGGSRSAEFNQRAIRDAQAAALSQQVEAMRQGYKEAADLYGTEASRALTAGQQIGALAGQDYTRLLDASRNLASIGQTAGQLGGTDYQRMLDAAQRMGILGESAQAAGLKEAGTLEAIGAQRQALGQKSADLAYQDFLEQREYPFTQLQKLTGIAGTPSASGSSTVQTAPAPSKTGQILGGLTGAVGLLGAAGVFKDGGPVEKKVPPMKSGLGWLKDKK
jgi:hypothetical protein